jgi:hypothetical protein
MTTSINTPTTSRPNAQANRLKYLSMKRVIGWPK